jgi:hypothetical protein
MREQSFNSWLIAELASSRMALISMYENRDRILYIEAPALRQKYLSIFGETENAVLQAELENSLLKRKIELIQAAINRREVIDLERIDELIERERTQKLTDIEQNDATLNELPQLSEKETENLKRLYHEIVRDYHPAVNADVTDTQKELYEKAVEAFKMQDIEAMEVIHDCLVLKLSDRDVVPLERRNPEKDEKEKYHEVASILTTDYTLAKTLYQFFSPIEDDIVVTDAIRDCDTKRKNVEEEIAKIKEGFPFNAVDTMNSKAKTEEYRAELQFRAQKSAVEKEELLHKIHLLTEEHVNVR